jgi:hypothetical protein
MSKEANDLLPEVKIADIDEYVREYEKKEENGPTRNRGNLPEEWQKLVDEAPYQIFVWSN